MRRAAALLMVGALIAGCGSSSSSSPVKRPRRPPPGLSAPSGAPSDAEVRGALGLPDRVPLRATGPAPAKQVRVVRAWLDDLRSGDVAAAARRFALPARFQNLDAVALIRTAAQAYAITSSLPCGAQMTTAGGAGGFVVYEARLTERPGASCGAGVGGVVRGAVLVRSGRMAEWYRLPDRSQPRRGQPATPSGPII